MIQSLMSSGVNIDLYVDIYQRCHACAMHDTNALGTTEKRRWAVPFLPIA